MARLTWGDPTERAFEYGLSHGVLYPNRFMGVPWNGLVSVDETPVGGEVSPLYFDGRKYHDFVASEFYAASVTALSSPPEFRAFEGAKQLAPGLFATQQLRGRFDFSYRTQIGDGTDSANPGYKIHLVYNATSTTANRSHQTMTEDVELMNLQWEFSTIPPPADGYKPTAHFVLDSTLVDPYRLSLVEQFIYGTSNSNPQMPYQWMVVNLLTVDLEELIDGGAPQPSENTILDGGTP